MPGLQLADYEGTGQDVEIACTVVSATPSKRANLDEFQVCPCQWASMVQKRRRVGPGTRMPSPGRSRSRNVRTKLSSQRKALGFDRASQASGKPPRSQRRSIRSWPTSARPSPPQAVVINPARERLRRLSEQIRRRAAQHQEPRPPRAAVRRHAKDRKPVGPALHLVDHDQTAQSIQNEPRVFRQAVEISGALQIQPMRRTWILPPHLTRQRRLADLARAQDAGHGKGAQPFQDGVDVLLPAYHRPESTMIIRRLPQNYHGRGAARTILATSSDLLQIYG